MSGIGQLKDLAELAQSFNSLDISGLVDSISQQVSAQSAATIATAVGELTDAGLDPKDYIAQPRSAMKAKQHQQRLNIEAAKAQQQLEHQAQLNALAVRKAEAELAVIQASANRLSGHTAPVPAPPVATTR